MIAKPPTISAMPARNDWWWRLPRIGLAFVALLMGACGFNKSGVVFPAYLETIGWRNPALLLKAQSFTVHATAVQREVLRSRVPFVAENATIEAMLASPQEFPTAAHCESTQGVAVLVHGLSDTAFSMRDLAMAVAENCYVARTVLLPGHGTRPGDLLTIRLSDWTAAIDYVLTQAASDHEHVVAIGFSLGAVLLLTEAIQPQPAIDGIVTISPAFYLTTSPWADLTRWLHPLRRWLDKEKPDDTYRYEAIPTVAVAQTIKAKNRLHHALTKRGVVSVPWLMVQSENDLVVRTEENRQLFSKYASHRASRSITFHGLKNNTADTSPKDDRFINLAGYSQADRVTGLTHVAIHQSPDNHHYARQGDYRNCGSGGPRSRAAVRQCEQAEFPWLGPWDEKAPDDTAFGMSTYNPHFDKLVDHLAGFLQAVRQPTTVR